MFCTTNQMRRSFPQVLLAIAVTVQWPPHASAQCTEGQCPATIGAGRAAPGSDLQGWASVPRPKDTDNTGAGPHPAVARVCCVERFGGRAYGSGTLVYNDGSKALVLTCAHLFGHATGTITVVFPNGRQFSAKLLAIDRLWDLAALAIDPPGLEPVTLADSYPQPGQVLRSCGYGSAGRYWCNSGRVLGYTRAAGTSTYETLVLTGLAREGDSGGPVLDQQGHLVGVLWGTDGQRVVSTYCGRLRQFLRRLLPSGPIVDGPELPVLPPEAGSSQSGAPASEQSPSGGLLDDLRQRLDALTGRVTEDARQRDRQQQSLGDRLAQVETALELVGRLRQRVEDAERTVGQDNLRAVVREVAKGVIAERAPGILEQLVPRLVAALGWTGPPSIAVVLAARLLARLIRRREARRRTAGSPSSASASWPPARLRPRPDAPVGQAAGAGQPPAAQSPQPAGVPFGSAPNRSDPQTEAVLAREYDWELHRAEQSGDSVLAEFAAALRRRVAERLQRVHGRLASLGETISGSR